MKKALTIGAVIAIAAAAAVGVYLWRNGQDVTQPISADGQRALESDPAKIAARRKQYVEQYRQLWRVDDVATVRDKAKAGNPIAQRRLYEIYEYCLGMRTRGASTLPLLSQMAQLDPALGAMLKELGEEHRKLCGKEGVGSEATGQARAFWMRESAKRGDLVSEMRVFVGEAKKPLTPDALKGFIHRTALSGDPAAMMEIASLLPALDGDWPDPATLPAVKGELAGHAWIIAACRAGMDCVRGSRLMTTACIRMMNCMRPNYESLLYTDMIPPARRPQVEAIIALIQGTLLRPDPKS